MAASLLGEGVNAITVFAAVLVVLCVVATQRTRVDQPALVTSRQ